MNPPVPAPPARQGALGRLRRRAPATWGVMGFTAVVFALQLASNLLSGVDLVLAGHLHHGYTGDIRTHHVDIRRAILVAQAGTATSHRVRNEANSYNVIRPSPQRLGFSLRVWDDKGFREAHFVEYVKSGSDWRPTLGRD